MVQWFNDCFTNIKKNTLARKDRMKPRQSDHSMQIVKRPKPYKHLIEQRHDDLPSGYLTVCHGIDSPFIDGLPIENGDFPWLC